MILPFVMLKAEKTTIWYPPGFGCESLTTSDAQWRIPLAIQIVPAIVLFGGMFFLPYSPRWLASVGREDEARSALVRLHGGERRADMDIIDAEFNEIQAQISWERENVSTSPLDLVRTRPNLHRTLCGCLVQAMCQWTGGELAGPRLVIPRRSSPVPHVSAVRDIIQFLRLNPPSVPTCITASIWPYHSQRQCILWYVRLSTSLQNSKRATC